MAKKILLVASHGGHWVQLNRIAKAFESMDLHFASTNLGLAGEVGSNSFHFVPDANLHEKYKLFKLALCSMILIFKVRPDFVISTGAAPGFFALMFGKLIGAKTIWIDSCANAEVMSMSGQKAKWVSDVWLTQWPQLAKNGGPEYWGAVI